MGWCEALGGESEVVAPPVEWDRALVMARLIEAADVERRIPMSVRPSGDRAAWPSVLMKMAEDIEKLDNHVHGGDGGGIGSRVPPDSCAVSRWEAVLDWYRLFIAPHRYCKSAPDVPSAIFAYTKCSVRPHLSLSGFCRRKGWTKRTTYNRISDALGIIADGLNQMGIPVVEADPDIVAPYISDTRGRF